MVQVKGGQILGELVPHRADNGKTGSGGLEEQVVHVVTLSVSLLDSSLDNTLNTGALEPWLTHLVALHGVGTEEGVVDSELVELNVEIILGSTSVAWDIVAGINNTRHTETEEHVDAKLNILKFGVVASSGNSSVSLGTEEEGSREKERSLLSTVTTEETLEGSALLESAIGVVDPTVLEDITISSHVSVVHGHANLSVVLSGFENGRLVHVVPDTVHVVSSLEDTGVEEIFPVVTGAIVKEINPNGFASAGLTLVGLFGGGVSNKEVGDVMLIDVLALLLEAFLVHEVVAGGADVGVGGDDEATAGVVDLAVHVHNIILRESLVVVLTILVVLSVLTVEPEDIDRETELGEVVVSLGDLVSRVLLPLAEVVSE